MYKNKVIFFSISDMKSCDIRAFLFILQSSETNGHSRSRRYNTHDYWTERKSINFFIALDLSVSSRDHLMTVIRFRVWYKLKHGQNVITHIKYLFRVK